MMSRDAREENFARLFKAEMLRLGFTVRGLARAFDPDDLDRGRRNVSRWRRGVIPSASSQERLAAVGFDPTIFEEPEPEQDSVSDLLHRLAAAWDRERGVAA